MKSVVILSALPAAVGFKRSLVNMSSNAPLFTKARMLMNKKNGAAVAVGLDSEAEFAVGYGCCNGDTCRGLVFSHKSTFFQFVQSLKLFQKQAQQNCFRVIL